jgi:hypothetical protein
MVGFYSNLVFKDLSIISCWQVNVHNIVPKTGAHWMSLKIIKKKKGYDKFINNASTT